MKRVSGIIHAHVFRFQLSDVVHDHHVYKYSQLPKYVNIGLECVSSQLGLRLSCELDRKVQPGKVTAHDAPRLATNPNDGFLAIECNKLAHGRHFRWRFYMR